MPVIDKAKAAYKQWLPMHRNMSRAERFGIGLKIDNLFLETLELLRQSTYASGERKIACLDRTSAAVDSLRFFVQLAWEAGLVSLNQFTELGGNIEEVGRMVGGWRKGLLSKTPAARQEKAENSGRGTDCRHSTCCGCPAGSR